MSRIGEYLKAKRESLGLTLRQVQDKTGVSNAYLCLIETGKRLEPHPNILRSLAAAYGEDHALYMKIAGYFEPTEEEEEKMEIETLFREAMQDEEVSFGHRLRGDIDFEAKRIIANLYKMKKNGRKKGHKGAK